MNTLLSIYYWGSIKWGKLKKKISLKQYSNSTVFFFFFLLLVFLYKSVKSHTTPSCHYFGFRIPWIQVIRRYTKGSKTLINSKIQRHQFRKLKTLDIYISRYHILVILIQIINGIFYVHETNLAWKDFCKLWEILGIFLISFFPTSFALIS